MIRALLILPAILIGCEQPNETLASYGAGDVTWQLVKLNGVDFSERATMVLEEDGSVSGRAACNSFQARQTVPYPWFKIEAVAATKTACPELAAETAFFTALSEMTLAEVSGDVLLLSNETGAEMLFEAE